MPKKEKIITKKKPTSQEKGSSLLNKPNLLNRKLDNIENIDVKEKEIIKNVLNKALEDRLLTAAGENRSALEKVLKSIKIDYEGSLDLDLKSYSTKFILPEVKKQQLSEETIAAIQTSMEKASRDTIKDILQLDAPVGENPFIGREFRKIQSQAFGEIAGLKAAALKKLSENDLIWNDVNEATFSSLVKDGTLTSSQKDDLLLISELTRLTGDNLELIQKLKTPQLKTMEDFIAWDKTDWVAFIKDNQIILPDDEESAESYADTIHQNIERTFPSQYFLKRIIKEEYDGELKLLDTVEKLQSHNDKIIHGVSVNPTRLNWEGISAINRKEMEKDLEELSSFSNAYRRLGVPEIINDSARDKNGKQIAIEKRLKALTKFRDNNPSLDLHKADLLKKDNGLNWQGIESEDQKPVKKQMLSYQRVLTVADDYQTSENLLKKGFDSAMSIASIPEEQFVQRSGLTYEAGRLVYLKAKDHAVMSSQYLEAVRDALMGSFNALAVANQDNIVNDLKDIDGFDDLFGNQDYCDCEHYRSIFGPAAYFTDLMFFVQENVSKKLFDPARPEHPLYLKNRRPDLWTIKYNYTNTNTEIPYLQVVNDVLEGYIRSARNTNDVYNLINASGVSTTLPVNLPLEELRLFLSHFNLSLYEICKTLKQPRPDQLREKLNISSKDLSIITTADPTNVKFRFGNEALANFNVQAFLEYARITREELDDLLNTKFDIQISGVDVNTKKDPSDIQKYSEVLKGLTDTRLDSIHRYLRLWKKTRWTLREFDLLLNSLKSAGLINTLGDQDPSGVPQILKLADLAIFQDELRLSPEESAAIADKIPLISVKKNRKSLFERLFDLEKIFGVASTAADGTKTYKTTVTLPADKTLDKITPLLLAGLGISESELKMLFSYLGIDISSDQQIDYAMISSLFRHCRIASGLRWTIESLIGAMKILFNGASIQQIDDVHKLIEFNQWLKKSPLKVTDLLFILNGEETSVKQFESNNDSSAAAIWEIQKAPETDKIKLLLLHLQKAFNLTSDQLQKEFLTKLVTRDFYGPDTEPLSPGMNKALNASFTNDQPDDLTDFDELTALKRELERVTLLFAKLEYSPETISFFVGQKDLFGIADLKIRTLLEIKMADCYRSLVTGTDQDQESNIQKALIQYRTNGHFSDESLIIFANVWRQPAGQLKSLANAFPFSAIALEAVQFLSELNILSKNLGIEGHNLLKLISSDYTELLTARDVALGAFSAKYPEENVRKERLDPYFDKINTIKRDALCDYIIGWKDRFKFQDRSDLYSFFLLDVDMSGFFKTSRIVSAISSLQLYIHRCLINLEQSDANLNPSIENVGVVPTQTMIEEWEWRKNYRVWEANRKVFLYPENYIDPALRDDKTHIFKELEDELLQEKVTRDSAEAAYKKYVAQFSELTKLRFAGAYYHSAPIDFNYWNFGARGFDGYFLLTGIFFIKESEESEYYLFARTNTDPYQYYYRTYNHYKQVWGNWTKIEMAIEADEISAVVFRGKLYVFWTEVQTKELNNVSGGTSTSSGVIFKVYTKYSFLNENGKWSVPQKVEIGHLFSEEELIFRRGVNNYPADQKDIDKNRDNAIKQFQKKVFRKPYAQILNQTDAPISLSYIWSHRDIATVSNYVVKSDIHNLFENGTDHAYDMGEHKIAVLESPEVAFTVIGSDFLNQQVVAKGTYREYVRKYLENEYELCREIEVDIVFILCSAGSCTVIVEVDNLSYYYQLQPSPYSAINSDITASQYKISLSTNRNRDYSNEDIEVAAKDIATGPFSFLKNEFEIAFNESTMFERFVENGKSSFTSSNRKILQYMAGDGELQLQNNCLNQEPPVPTTTVLTDELMDILYAKGLEQFLSLETQKITNNSGQQLNMKGAYGEYYWELFFHIPFLIANHLNANQKFKEAKWWYERIFNPTSEETPARSWQFREFRKLDIEKIKDVPMDSHAIKEILDNQQPSDHNWQFREFRNLNIEKLKDILTDNAAICAYKEDPFNPHAIARLRTNAYQKSIVMKYIDNLIDWGDYLFTQDTRESINEASMLYQLAYDILGKRPAKLGKCEIADENVLTYEKIQDRIGEESEFLITLENSHWNIRRDYLYDIKPLNASKHLANSLQNADLKVPSNQLLQVAATATQRRMSDPFNGTLNADHAGSMTATTITTRSMHSKRVAKYDHLTAVKRQSRENRAKWVDIDKIPKEKLIEKRPGRFPIYDMAKNSVLVFCIPHNADLLGYWDRVEDRLYKIRQCMNISGVRRSLALFQPPIDPALLVRARAAGLSMDDILALIAGSASLPPYRFEYLLEKAKQFTQTVQGFGNALLSAIEKKDVEELTLLRSVHEQNILKLTKDIKKKQLQEAQYQYQAMQETLKNVQNKVQYYQGLIDEGLIPWEITQQVSRHVATAFKLAESVVHLMAGITYLIPQVGSPFSMKYGGQELGNSGVEFAQWTSSMAAIAEAVSSSASLEAGFQRREEEWDYQLTLAMQEEAQANKQLLAAEIRQSIAEKEIEIHEKTIDQAKELHSFYKDKFTNLGLYNFLSANLNRIYRQAYNIAVDMARMAERAYRFEQNADTFFIAGDNWESDKAGLLSAERLQLQLQQLEQEYMKGNKRKPEITQTFSLALLDPRQLIELRQTGTCAINIPEIAFELFYPGQYRRLIKSVRITIPGIVGPYTNVSARLMLIKGMIEKDDQSALEDHPIAKNTFISTSGAVNDAGMFDFNFRDERYLPFEGAGAISEWKLELPSKIRAFNYDTIADILLTISYTAIEGNREAAENALVDTLTDYGTSNGLLRLFSLKHELPNAFHKLLNPEQGKPQSSEFSMEYSHFPYFLRNRDLNITQTTIYLKPQSGRTITLPASLTVNGTNAVSWNTSDDVQCSEGSGAVNTIKGGTVSITGSPIKTWKMDAGVNGLIKDELDDILISVKYGI